MLGSFFAGASNTDASGTFNNVGANQYNSIGAIHIYQNSNLAIAHVNETPLSNETLVESCVVGSSNGDYFNDATYINCLPRSPTVTGIARISIFHGEYVPGINVTYELSNGQTLLRKHGNRAPIFDSEDIIDFRASEILASVSGRHSGGAIDEISFVVLNTKTGTVRTFGPFGNHRSRWYVPTLNRGKVFQVSGPIVAFGGWAQDATLSLGLYGLTFIGVGDAPTVTFT